MEELLETLLEIDEAVSSKEHLLSLNWSSYVG